MSLKAQLKAARSALASDEYGLALSSADRVLAFETDNYLALVFRAAALEGLGRIPDAEQAFEKSISTKPEESLAWDGLIKLYRKLGRWDAVSVTLRRLADALFAAGNAVKLAETLQALLHLVQQSAGQDQLVQVLLLFLPSSPYYAILSTLPVADQTNPQATTTFETQLYVHDPHSTLNLYRQCLQILFNLEQEVIDKEVQARRMRLPSNSTSRGLAITNKDAMTNAAGVNIWSKSLIPSLLEGVLNHAATTDEGRRWAEAELLRYQYRLLLALPEDSAPAKGKGANKTKAPSKSLLKTQVQDMARGMVLLGIPDPLAWKIHLDWQDTTLFQWSDPIGQRLAELRQCVIIFDAVGVDASQAFQLAKPTQRRRKNDRKGLVKADPSHLECVAVAAAAKAILVKLNDPGLAQYEQEKRNKQQTQFGGTGVLGTTTTQDEDVDLELAGAASDKAEIDPLALAVAAQECDPTALFPQRLCALFSLLDADWAASEDSALSALQFVRTLERASSLSLANVKTALNATVAAALVRRAIAQGALAYSPPPLTASDKPPEQSKNDEDPLLIRAHKYIEGVLRHQPDNLDTLFELGLALECQKEWASAAEVFTRVEDLSEEGQDLSDSSRSLHLVRAPDVEARAELGWCETQQGLFEVGSMRLDDVSAKLEAPGQALLANHIDGGDTYRACTWWRVGECAWRWMKRELQGGDVSVDELQAHKTRAFTAFITSLKRSPSFAPSFTSLGFYYQDEAHLASSLAGEKKQTNAYSERSVKCFQKAFELDPREAAAGYELAREFSNEREWELVEVIARRVIQGEGGPSSQAQKARGGKGLKAPAPTASATRNSWAWKAIGNVELQANHAEEAISAFQVALRSEEDSALLWHQLGDAYARAGRYTASLKALRRAWELASEDMNSTTAIRAEWPILYTASEVYSCIGKYEASLALLWAIMEALPDPTPGADPPPELSVVRVAYAETHLLAARHAEASGHPGRSRLGYMDALRHALAGDTMARTVWKVVADSAWALGSLPPRTLKFPELALLQQAVEAAQAMEVDTKLAAVTTGSRQAVLDLISRVEAAEKDSALDSNDTTRLFAEACSLTAVHVYKMLVVVNAGMGEQVAAAAWYDLAMALSSQVHRASEQTVPISPDLQDETTQHLSQVRSEAMGAVRESLQLDSTSARSWALLGNLAGHGNPKLAQHALIRAIESDPRSPIPWTQLGFIYVGEKEAQLANQAFVRAQALDPDYAPAWVGQGVVASQFYGDMPAAKVLFEHAVRLSEGSLAAADYGLAYAAHTILVSPPGGTAADMQARQAAWTDLHIPAFALDAYLAQPAGSMHVGAQLLAALFAERVGAHALAVNRVNKAAVALEAQYEATEDEGTMLRYGLAQVNLARVSLAQGEWERAEQVYEGALALLPETNEIALASTDAEAEQAAGVSPSLIWLARTQARAGLALAHFFQLRQVEQVSQAVPVLQEALSDMNGSVAEVDHVTANVEAPMSVLRRELATVEESFDVLGQNGEVHLGSEQEQQLEQQLQSGTESTEQTDETLQAMAAAEATAARKREQELLNRARDQYRARAAQGLVGVHDDLVCILAQALFVAGAPDQATEALMGIISERPQCARAVLQLAAAGIAQGEEDLLDAALEEVHALPLHPATMEDIAALLALHKFTRGEADEGVSELRAVAYPRGTAAGPAPSGATDALLQVLVHQAVMGGSALGAGKTGTSSAPSLDPESPDESKQEAPASFKSPAEEADAILRSVARSGKMQTQEEEASALAGTSRARLALALAPSSSSPPPPSSAADAATALTASATPRTWAAAIVHAAPYDPRGWAAAVRVS